MAYISHNTSVVRLFINCLFQTLQSNPTKMRALYIEYYGFFFKALVVCNALMNQEKERKIKIQH